MEDEYVCHPNLNVIIKKYYYLSRISKAAELQTPGWILQRIWNRRRQHLVRRNDGQAAQVATSRFLSR